MGLFEQFPFTNFHEMNLDWIITQVKDIPDTVKNEVEKVLNADIASIISNITSTAINIKNPPSPLEPVKDDVDSSAQMQAIVNYCAENGYSVFIPTGRYIFNNITVTLNKNPISINGCGKSSTIDSTGGDCFIFNGGDGSVTPCIMSNLYIKNANRGYYFKNLSYICAINLYAHACGTGFDIENVDHSAFISCSSRWCSQYGIDIHSRNLIGYTAPNNIAFYACRFGNSSGPGIHLYLASNIVFNACSIEYNNNFGILAEYCGGQGGTQFIATENYFEGNKGTSDISITSGALSGTEIEGTAIISNNSFNKVNGSASMVLTCNIPATNKSTVSFTRNTIEYYGTFTSDDLFGLFGSTDFDATYEFTENKCANQAAVLRVEYLTKQFINASIANGTITAQTNQYFTVEGSRISGFTNALYILMTDGATVSTQGVAPGLIAGYPGLFIDFAGTGTISIIKL